MKRANSYFSQHTGPRIQAKPTTTLKNTTAMARLLLVLACATGAAGVMDALDIKAVCEVPTDGGPRKIYLGLHLGRDADAHPRVLRVQLSTPDPGHHACP